MKASVIHHTINSLGGEASVALETIEALYELGYEVELITVQKPNLNRIFKAYGKSVHVKHVKPLFPFKFSGFGIYQRLLTVMPSLNLKDSDIIINTNGNSFPLNISNDTFSILYVHFPSLLLSSEGYNNTKYQKSLFWRAYFKPYHILANKFTKNALSKAKLIITNSKFTNDALKTAYPNTNSHTVYPPVDIDRFSNALNSNSRERKVLVVSRFSHEKQIENAIKIAHHLKNINFEIIGSLIPANRQYYNHIKEMIQSYALENRIRLIPNASHKELIDAMSTSSIYLHTMKGEHFGISVVEAMAGGLLPIVPSYGGCAEIAPQDYQYNTIQEAAELISKSINAYDETIKKDMHSLSKQFSSSQFRDKLKQHIKENSGLKDRTL